MTPELEARIAEIDRAVGPEMVLATWQLFTPLHQARGYQASAIERDKTYGPDPRHRLDLHLPAEPGEPRPVLLFVHGGGFVGGDKHTPGMPHYDHIGRWAVDNGLLGVTMTYRLAPAHQWPAGADDVAAAVAWVRANIAEHGGDPNRIVLSGHSAGATHVACYLARNQRPAGIVGAALLSGIYDLETAERNEILTAYFGADPATYPAQSPLPGLVEAAVPRLYSVAELNPVDFHRQAARIVDAHVARHGEVPPFVWVRGHNHISEIASLGVDDTLGEALRRFVERACRDEQPLAGAAKGAR